MSIKFTESFKIQAVEKALSRSEDVSMKELADSLGVGCSSLQRWIHQSNNQILETASANEISTMNKEKRPQDWSQEERLEMVISCGSLDEQAVSKQCRAEGLYPHHVNQWKNDFLLGKTASTRMKTRADVNSLKSEIKALQKELTRKDKALAETAALLILKKKANLLWGFDEESSQ